MKIVGTQNTPPEGQKEDNQSKIIRRRAQKNGKICNEKRVELIDRINRSKSFRISALKLGIPESTAKSIYYKFMRTGKITRKKRKSKFDHPKYGLPKEPIS